MYPDDYPGHVPGEDPDDERIHYVRRGAGLADHWGLVLAYGILLTGSGLVLALWPKQTLVVSAVTLSFALIITGMSRMFLAMGSMSLSGSTRGLVGLSGILAVVFGALALREPVQTLLLLGLMIGVWLLVAGFVDIISAALSTESRRRVWDVAIGILNIVVGGVLIVHPHVSLGLLVVLICVWLFSHGGISIVSAFQTRAQQHAAKAGTSA